MVKGTDLILGIQVLIVQHKICQDLQVVVSTSDKFKGDTTLSNFFVKQFRLSKSLRTDLQNLLINLGNAYDHTNMDNLHNFIQEKHLPALNHDSFSCKAYKAVKRQYFLLVESYNNILAFKSLPVAVESILLYHLAELQGAAAFMIDHQLEFQEPSTEPTAKFDLAV
ncbi:hypothetical protein [Flavimarina sp. Hel_I_48]|uniref:hypothetical protein n=1 Tax=Flavimarina sp. Hel_I_48 TaxID=1392488 RepID=UPI0004DF4997|nr:hypothetical protein [Flavimarina sp. Hel_I_48]